MPGPASAGGPLRYWSAFRSYWVLSFLRDTSRMGLRSIHGTQSVARSASRPIVGREPQPPLRTPTRIAWTSATLEQVASGNEKNGALVALNCGACHGEGGVSPSTLIPTLAGMDAVVIYKQLDDYGSGKRLWGVMNAIAHALSVQDSADVAGYFAGRADGLPPVAGEGIPQGGRSLRQSDPTVRILFAGDPGRGIPPARLVTAPAPTSLEPRRCKASTPLTLNANLRLSRRACGRTTSTSRCAQLQPN